MYIISVVYKCIPILDPPRRGLTMLIMSSSHLADNARMEAIRRDIKRIKRPLYTERAEWSHQYNTINLSLFVSVQMNLLIFQILLVVGVC